MKKEGQILCIGEVLWDSMPKGLFLGGAPLNVAYHLKQLGEKAQVISRVGDDRLGREALRRIKRKNVEVGLIQQDADLETGFVSVQLDADGNPDYEIIKPVAWDNISLTEQIKEVVKQSWGLVYGTLAMRDECTRNTIFSLLEEDLVKVLDINLRAPFFRKELVESALQYADILKLNEGELQQLTQWFDLPQQEQEAVEALSKRFHCPTVAVTKGGAGAHLFHRGTWAKHSGFQVTVKDAVGAGDAFLASLLFSLRSGRAIQEALAFANTTGAYVASHAGATPEYTIEDIREMVL